MKQFIFSLLTCMAVSATNVYAQGMSAEDSARVRNAIEASGGDADLMLSVHKFKTLRSSEDAETDDTSKNYLVVTTSAPGTLDSLLGDEAYDVDSLVVEGPLNADDFTALWKTTFHGNVSVLNLQNAQVEGNKIPDYAFIRKEQVYPDYGLYITNLRKVMLSDNIEEIGRAAFEYCVKLEEINMPISLVRIGDNAFYCCKKLLPSSLVFYEDLKEIGRFCFYDCEFDNADIVLPTSIKSIGDYAFWMTGIGSVNFPDGLERIGESAFSSCKLREIDIPSTCQDLGPYCFSTNFELRKIRLGEGISTIPEGFVQYAIALEEVDMPKSVIIIKKEAFYGCSSLKNIEFHEGLGEIDENAFNICSSLESLVLPSTLTILEKNSFADLRGLRNFIYVKAVNPPYVSKNINGGGGGLGSAFGVKGKSLTPSTVLYVPIGSAGRYNSAPGWGDYFDNIIEVEDGWFPPTGIGNVSAAGGTVSAYAKTGGIVIDAQGGDTAYAVFTADGKTVAEGTVAGGSSVSVPCGNGLYVVKAGTSVSKIIVR